MYANNSNGERENVNKKKENVASIIENMWKEIGIISNCFY